MGVGILALLSSALSAFGAMWLLRVLDSRLAKRDELREMTRDIQALKLDCVRLDTQVNCLDKSVKDLDDRMAAMESHLSDRIGKVEDALRLIGSESG